jgi:Tol biopolymer transport system component
MSIKMTFCYLIIVGCILSGCTTINENITSNPSEADIYWGKTEDNLKYSGKKTPSRRAASILDIESWCYQARKSGYYPSEIICRRTETKDRNINLTLSPIKEIQSSVSVTGSVIALKRITTGRLSENNPRLCPQKKWLLVEVSGDEQNKIKRKILEKINLETGAKVILTSPNSNSKEGDWLPDSSAIVYASDRMANYTIVKSFGTTGETAVRFISQSALGPARYPCVSPDGKDIAFSIFRSWDDNDIYVIGIDGNNLRAYGQGFQPEWSSDGKTLLFTRKVGNYMNIYSMDGETGVNLTDLSSLTLIFKFPPFVNPKYPTKISIPHFAKFNYPTC